MTPKQTEKPERRPYRKPVLSQVPLKPEEAVLGNCKMSGVRGPGITACNFPVSCYAVGS